jgi:hypothetical protein
MGLFSARIRVPDRFIMAFSNLLRRSLGRFLFFPDGHITAASVVTIAHGRFLLSGLGSTHDTAEISLFDQALAGS